MRRNLIMLLEYLESEKGVLELHQLKDSLPSTPLYKNPLEHYSS